MNVYSLLLPYLFPKNITYIHGGAFSKSSIPRPLVSNQDGNLISLGLRICIHSFPKFIHSRPLPVTGFVHFMEKQISSVYIEANPKSNLQQTKNGLWSFLYLHWIEIGAPVIYFGVVKNFLLVNIGFFG